MFGGNNSLNERISPVQMIISIRNSKTSILRIFVMMDSYIDVKEVCQNTSFAAGVDSIVKNCSGNRRLETGQVSNWVLISVIVIQTEILYSEISLTLRKVVHRIIGTIIGAIIALIIIECSKHMVTDYIIHHFLYRLRLIRKDGKNELRLFCHLYDHYGTSFC